MKIKELLEGLEFRGYPCTYDCSGHQAGWEYAVHWGLEPDECPYGNSNSFWEGCKSHGEEQELEENHYTTAVIEDAVDDLEKDLQHPHSYDAIDHMMQTIAREQDITPKQLHDLFVKKHGMTPDEWIKDQEQIKVTEDSFGGIDIDMDIEDDEIMVRAIANGRELGHVLFVDEGGYLMPQDLEVDERFQGQGIAAAMYDYVKSKGYKIRRSGQQTDAGAGFWGKHRPEQNVWENFADGKVKGRSRPGRVKRAGASCAGSVTSLRQKAKNASGEKAKMYHWCANMKSGRKK
jgi:hypothetical protein